MMITTTLGATLLLLATQATTEVAVPDLTCRLEEHGGTRVLYLAGTLEERGFGEGKLLCKEILGCFEEFALPYVTRDDPKLWDRAIRLGVLTRFEIPAATREWSKAILRGMEAAHGGPITIEALERPLDAFDVLVWSTVPDLAGFACSSLAVWGAASASGDVLVGRNLDYSSSPLIEKNSIIEVHAPLPAKGDRPARAGWVGVGWPGTFGCLTGLSEHGVFAAIHDVYGGDPRPGQRYKTRMLALSELLETARPASDLPETLAKTLRARPFAMGGNFMIAWQGEGDTGAVRGAAVIEVGVDEEDDGVTPRRPKPNQPWIACSNDHYLREGTEPGCGRYATLMEGASATIGEDGLGARDMWGLVDEAGMTITLYRCVADLGQQLLTVQRRVEKEWSERTAVSAIGGIVEQ